MFPPPPTNPAYASVRETGDKRLVPTFRRQEIGTVSKHVMGDNVLKYTYVSLAEFFDGANVFPKMWRGGGKIKWRGVAVALMRWSENFS